ncbi:hypothetical protein DENSPDRAFT_639231 [Dentipellis sp. KUC8613]|nr:hypothetical protein DENSPDRAFT_639231 [Dentipellis sp. KUC8613]
MASGHRGRSSSTTLTAADAHRRRWKSESESAPEASAPHMSTRPPPQGQKRAEAGSSAPEGAAGRAKKASALRALVWRQNVAGGKRGEGKGGGVPRARFGISSTAEQGREHERGCGRERGRERECRCHCGLAPRQHSGAQTHGPRQRAKPIATRPGTHASSTSTNSKFTL